MEEAELQELLKPQIFVFCQDCNEWRNERMVETLGIEEDFFGRDNLSFHCDRCGTFNQSLRVSK
jgi:hypothetical protein